MEAFLRVSMLVEMGAIKEAQPVLISGEMRGHPVQNHANSLLVQIVNKIHEVLRRAIAAGGSEVSCGLVSPGAIEGMLHDGQKLHMGKSHLLDIFSELRCQFTVGEETVGFLWLRRHEPRCTS